MTLDRQRLRIPEPAAMARQLTAGRTVAGAVILAAPVLSARLLGTDSATAQRVVWLTRMMAVRDAALGAGGFVATRGDGPVTPWLIGGAACDAVDALVLGHALRTGRAKGIGAVAVVPFAIGAAAAGVFTAVRMRGR